MPSLALWATLAPVGWMRVFGFVTNISIWCCRMTKREAGWNCFRQILCSGLRVLCWCCVCHYPFVALAAMHSGVACRAQRDQVFIRVASRMAAKLSVVHLKIRHRATRLTPPAVATQDLLAQTFVRQGIQPRRSGFGVNHSHDAFSRRFSRNACCCSPGKNLCSVKSN